MIAQSTPVTIHLPNTVYRKLQQAARTTNRGLEDILLQTISGNIPPSVEEAPADVRAELEPLQWLDEENLWAVARSRLASPQQERQLYLLRQNQRGAITATEKDEMERLGDLADRLTLKKAYAYALLRWRGFPLPALETIEDEV
ncbi:MAG: hypothetical protein K1X65_24660 [Caldilineales bacterium]|nr:hypothetical protein [Caldilineales bacterium]MCW5861119.1 hypothetical protein [Caldilineales bacterium]